MTKYVCVTKCYTDRIWNEGDTVVAEKRPNEHFVVYKETEAVIKEDGEPETLAELQEREAEAFLKGSRNGANAVQGKTGQEAPVAEEPVLEIPDGNADVEATPGEELPLG